jgi:hypothetical protein
MRYRRQLSNLNYTGTRAGQSIIEAVVGVLVLIPIVLLAIDANYLLSANRSNQELAHNVARAAANQTDTAEAEKSANKTVDGYEKTSLVKSVVLSEFVFDVPSKLVTVTTTMEVAVPVPMPWTNTVRITAHWLEPIVALPASK